MEHLANWFNNLYTWQIIGTIIISIILTVLFNYSSIFVHSLYIKTILWIQTFALKYGYPPYKNICTTLKSYFFKTKKYRQPKGLVGVIAVNFKNVKHTNLSSSPEEDLGDIHFADKNGDYDNRNTHLDEAIIRLEYEKIVRYYELIGCEIEANFKDNLLFQYSDMEGNNSIRIDVLLKKIYSLENIKIFIDKVNKESLFNNAIHFIGDKIGVKDFNINDDGLELVIYKTDHFTWQVFKEIFKANKPFFQEIMLRINHANLYEKKMLVRCLAFVFSSFGIDIIIESKDCRNKRKLFITARSGKIETNAKSSLHVSVNETFSRTDFIGDSTTSYGLYECVKRGIEEELGISEAEINHAEDKIKNKNKHNAIIKFHDFAIVTDEGEIGLSCHVDLSGIIPAEKIGMYPGQDKFLENEDLLILPYFNIKHYHLIKASASATYMRMFYKTTLNDRFNMLWMSFTPLLISRMFIRNIRLNSMGKLAWFSIYWLLVLLVIWCVYPQWMVLYLDNIALLVFTAFLTLVWNGIKSIINRTKREYYFIQPFLSQWYGNAKVLQSSGYAKEKTNDGVHFCFDNSTIIGSNTLSSNQLRCAPYCSIRRKKFKDQYSEMPVSYFNISNIPSKGFNSVYFSLMNIAITQVDVMIKFSFEYLTDENWGTKKIKNIKFSDKINIESSFLIDYIDINNSITKKLSQTFSDKYQLFDLFEYNRNYYWSCLSKTKLNCNHNLLLKWNNRDKTKDLKMSFYDYVLNQINQATENKGVFEICVKGDKKQMEMFLNSFISHPENRRRISELDLYMLQLCLIRDNILLADIQYRIWHKKIYLQYLN